MESGSPTPKEEYEEVKNDSFNAIIKKEEDIVPKYEDNNRFFSSPAPYYDDQMTVPWIRNSLGFQSFNSYSSTCPTIIEQLQKKYFGKPFIIIKEPSNKSLLLDFQHTSRTFYPDDSFINVKIEQEKQGNSKKHSQLAFCKNYVGLLCSGFARTVLQAKYGSTISQFIRETLAKRKAKYSSLRNQDESKLIDSFRTHIHKLMCGKKVRKLNRERDFKIRNTRDLQNLWKILDKDSELTRLKKEALREVVLYFFESDYYDNWLANGKMTRENRNFFVSNKIEIQNKFLNPGVYKPKFNRTSE